MTNKEQFTNVVDPRFITKLQGKDFITHEGLLDLFHKNGGDKIITELVQSDPYIFMATVSGEWGIFMGHGDADDNNVNKMVASHKIRMAETRAINRALRFYNNVGMCSTEELGGKEEVLKEERVVLPSPTKEELINCVKCGESNVNEKVREYSERIYKKVLCYQCQKLEGGA